MIHNSGERPSWMGKPLPTLTAEEIADALTFLDEHDMADEILTRVLINRMTDRLTVVAPGPPGATGDDDHDGAAPESQVCNI